MPAAIRSLALVVNARKTGAADLAQSLLATADKLGVTVRSTDQFPVPQNFLADCDACCVIGGDGTLLGIAADAARGQIPIIGVNRGYLGFLTTLSADEAPRQFQEILAGKFQISHRSLIQCRIDCDDTPLTLTALNDIVIKDERNSQLVRLEVYADDQLVTDYFSDGLIVSTPTGSTAYNLSAGGPLIHPDAAVIAMTPICPHTLSNRSIIFRDDVRLRIRNRDPQARLLVAADGRQNPILCESKPFEITLAPMRLPLVQHADYAHFSVVRKKLNWSGSHGPITE
ncbi:NAD(+)/NADH kinase [Ereboglobus luteus]|uniref:NAD kinase n=1 Tax=Ereboglobus luteus TaxID=1796921 RepID=A0A2U8E7W6_9BACT|nr:NAD(+)/NADH kinase [Ereboglobus luteus]AWI10712.1 NAD(+) kinase [Ereboglobus luteus]